MKVKSALNDSISHAKFYTIVLPIVLIVTAFFPNTITFIILGVTGFSFVGEVVNIVYIKRRARKNPDFLEEKTK